VSIVRTGTVETCRQTDTQTGVTERITGHILWRCNVCSADGKYEVSYKPNVVIHSDGSVLWIPPAIYKSSCTIDVKYFPFDEQSCFMKFGSWTFNGDQVNLEIVVRLDHS